jgi:hypothetical protein
MSEENRARRILVPKPSQISKPVLAPSVQDLLDDALSVVSYEITRLKQKVMKDPVKGLDLKESKILQGYVKSLVDLSKEERERSNDADLANMSDEELLQLMENLRQRRMLKAGANE